VAAQAQGHDQWSITAGARTAGTTDHSPHAHPMRAITGRVVIVRCRDLQPLRPGDTLIVELKLLTGRRNGDLVHDRTHVINRLR
jgi:acyl dehydratase